MVFRAVRSGHNLAITSMAKKTSKKSKFPKRPPTLSPAAYRNVTKCRHTSSKNKIAYLKAIAKCGSNDAKAEAVHAKLRRGQLRKGPAPSGLQPTEGLGVLVSETQFLR